MCVSGIQVWQILSVPRTFFTYGLIDWNNKVLLLKRKRKKQNKHLYSKYACMCECMCVIVCDWERCVQKQVKCFQRNTSAVTWNTRKQSIVLILEKHLIRLLVSFSPVLVHILLLSACVRCSLVENKSNAGLPYLKSFKQFFSGFFFSVILWTYCVIQSKLQL